MPIGATEVIGAAKERFRPGPKILVGVDSYRPSVGFDDEIWFSTDTGDIWIGTGTGWARLSPRVLNLVVNGTLTLAGVTLTVLVGGLVAPASGAVSHTVTIGVTMANTNYQVVPCANWNTTVWYSNKTTTAFDLGFSTPAPASGAEVSWVVRL